MAELLQALGALAVGAATALGVRAVVRARPRALRTPNRPLTWAIIAASAGAATTAPVAPTGIDGVDAAYVAGFAAVVTFAAGRSRREPRLVAGAIAAIGSAGAWPWALVAFVALGLAAGSAAVHRPARPLGTFIGALQAQVLLRLAFPDIPYATALLAAVAAGVLVASGLRHARRRERRGLGVLLGAVAGAGIVVVALLGIGGYDLGRDLVGGARAADRGLDAARGAETGDAVEQLELADRRLRSASQGFDDPLLGPARYLPVVGRYLEIGEEVALAATEVIEPALESARLADGDALRIHAARVDLEAVAALRPPLVETLAAVPPARRSIASLAEERLPDAVERRIRDLDRSLVEAVDAGEFLLGALDLVPQLLGAEEPRRWVVVMQTPSEQRASGGIAGGYGELLIDDGRLDLVRAGEGNDLRPTDAGWDLGDVAAEYERFGTAGPERYFQNLTNVPHFPAVGEAVAAVYPQATGVPVDGVMSVDPKVLAALLELTGSITVPTWPEPITAENAERILLHEQYLRLDPDTGGQLVVDVIDATFGRLESATLPAPARLLRTLSRHVQAGRLQLYSPLAAEQELFEEMGVAGAMPEVDGDFLQVVTLNNSANKIDWYQQRTLAYDVVHDPATGEVDATATIAITNGAPAEGASELLIGGLRDIPGPPGRSRLTIDVYSALELQGATVDGEPVRMSGDRAFDRNLYWTTQTIGAGETRILEVFLTGFLEPGAPYTLDLGMQPVITPDDVSVRVTPVNGWAITTARGFTARDGSAEQRFPLTEHRRFVVRSER